MYLLDLAVVLGSIRCKDKQVLGPWEYNAYIFSALYIRL